MKEGEASVSLQSPLFHSRQYFNYSPLKFNLNFILFSATQMNFLYCEGPTVSMIYNLPSLSPLSYELTQQNNEI